MNLLAPGSNFASFVRSNVANEELRLKTLRTVDLSDSSLLVIDSSLVVSEVVSSSDVVSSDVVSSEVVSSDVVSDVV